MSTSTFEYAEDQPVQIPDLSEMGPIITALKLGTSMTKFSARKTKPESNTFQLILEDFKISCLRAGTGKEEVRG